MPILQTNNIIDNYKVIKPLGHGAFGYVYLVSKVNTEEKFAMKVFEKEEDKDREYYFEKYLYRLKDKCPRTVICVYEEGTFISDEQKYYYIILEYMNGYSLEIPIRDFQPIDDELLIKFMYYITEGIKYLHSKGVIHNDISPDNIMFNENKLKIIDLGMSCNINASSNNLTGLPYLLSFVMDESKIANAKLKHPPYPCFVKNYGFMSSPEMLGARKLLNSKDKFHSAISSVKSMKNYTFTKELFIKSDIWSVGRVFAELAGYSYNEDINILEPVYKRDKIDTIIQSCLSLDYTIRPDATELLEMIKQTGNSSGIYF